MTLRALISVFDKTGIVEFARRLQTLNIAIVSTGGTSQLLREHSIAVTEVSAYTGFPEMMDGRVKTLHPKIYGGILRRAQDSALLAEQDIETIDIVIVNLYPFQQVIQDPLHGFAAAIENIDIGGPCLLRAAAKNHAFVTVLCDPGDYASVLTELQQGNLSSDTRLYLAQKAFAHTAYYDSVIANYLANKTKPARSIMPRQLNLVYEKQQNLRYGENPQQQAAFYRKISEQAHTGLAGAKQLQGKELSYNNLVDADTALQCVQEFTQATCVIVKHANPCGVAMGETLLAAYQHAYAGDPTSAFGGIIAFNQTVDENLARLILQQQFVEVLLAPAITPAALACFKDKPQLRLLCFDIQPSATTGLEIRSISGGILLQTQDAPPDRFEQFNNATLRCPRPAEYVDLLFAWQVVKYIKSNAIVFVKNKQTYGIGAGQTSRVDSVRIAIQKAQEFGFSLAGAVMASDAFFPFADGIELAAQAGITAVIQPGGSKRDNDVIAAADAARLAMVFTGIRHFRH